MLIDEVRESFEASPFFSHIGFEIIHFQEGKVLLKLPITQQLLNVNGTLHGGVHAAMLDMILGMAIRTTTKTRCVTMNLNVNYLAPAISGNVLANGKIINQGYRTVGAEGEQCDEQEKLVAKGSGTDKLVRD